MSCWSVAARACPAAQNDVVVECLAHGSNPLLSRFIATQDVIAESHDGIENDKESQRRQHEVEDLQQPVLREFDQMLNPHEAVGDVEGFPVAQPLLGVQKMKTDGSDDQHDPKEAQDGQDTQDRLPEVVHIGPAPAIGAVHGAALCRAEARLQMLLRESSGFGMNMGHVRRLPPIGGIRL